LRAQGVTSCAVVSSTTSERVTPPSSLILAHAPDQMSLIDFSCPYFDESLQVAVSPCWQMALPNVISVIFVKVLVPLPRGVSLVQLTVTSQRTSASRQARHVRHTQTIPVMQFQLGGLFRGCSNSFMFRLPYLLDPPIAPTAIPTLSEYRAAGPFTPRNELTITRQNCGIATCLNRSIDTMGLSPTRLRPCWPLPWPCILDPPGFGLPLPGLPSGFTTVLPAEL